MLGMLVLSMQSASFGEVRRQSALLREALDQSALFREATPRLRR